MRRHLDLDPDQLVAMRSAPKVRHAPALQAKSRIRLRAGRNFECRLSLQRRHMNRPAERGQRELDRNLAEEIVALALKYIVLLNVNHDIKIARFTSTGTRLTVAGRTQFVAGVHASRNLDVDLRRFIDAAFSAALRADFFKPMPGAMTRRACLSNVEESARRRHLTGTAARRTCSPLRTGLRAAAMAVTALAQLAK